MVICILSGLHELCHSPEGIVRLFTVLAVSSVQKMCFRALVSDSQLIWRSKMSSPPFPSRLGTIYVEWSVTAQHEQSMSIHTVIGYHTLQSVTTSDDHIWCRKLWMRDWPCADTHLPCTAIAHHVWSTGFPCKMALCVEQSHLVRISTYPMWSFTDHLNCLTITPAQP